MKILNRGFLIVRHRQPYFDWCKQFEAEMHFNEEDGLEPNIYLIEDDFMEIEPIIKANYKKIFYNELEAVTDEDDAFPEINEENFNAWFFIEEGTTTFDTLSSQIERY